MCCIGGKFHCLIQVIKIHGDARKQRIKTPEKYTSLRVGVHWLMVLLLVAVYAAMELRDFFPKESSVKEGLKTWRFMLGLSVLPLVVLRLLARWTQPGPPEVQGAA